MHNLIEFLKTANANIVVIVGLVTGILYLAKQIQNLRSSLVNLTKKMLEDEFKSIRDEIETVSDKVESTNKKIDKVDENATRNFLVRCIADFDNHVKVNEAVKIRFWEQYDHYTDPDGMDGNSYIKTSVARLLKEGKISR